MEQLFFYLSLLSFIFSMSNLKMKCNMKNLFKSFVVLLAVMAAVPSFAQKANNTLTEKEKKQGWTLLFNGKDFTGWRPVSYTHLTLPTKLEV